MLKLFKDTFKTTNDCIILAAPLILFLSILGWYYSYATDSINTVPEFILACITMLVMFSGFTAAWLYMAKKTIALSKKVFVFDKDRAKALAKLIMTLPNGIGRLFLPILGAISTYILIYLLFFTSIGLLINNVVGTIDFSSIDYRTLFVSTGELFEEIKLFSQEELKIINYWYILLSTCGTIITFLTMLWIPEIVYAEKNSYKALAYSLKKLFKSFKTSLLLFICIYFLLLAITILSILLMFNPFLYFFVLMIYYYFLVYIVVLLFTYYENKFINN